MPLFHTILFGDTYKVQYTQIEERWDQGKWRKISRIHFPNERTTLTEDLKTLTRNALEALVSHIHIEFNDQPPPNPCGATSVRRSLATGAREAVMTLSGCQFDGDSDDLAYSTWYHINIARIMAHEFTHAVMWFKHSQLGQTLEAYFGDDLVGEDGYTFEVRAFGGILNTNDTGLDRPHYYNGKDLVPSKLAHTILLSEWPDPGHVKMYCNIGAVICVRGPINPVHRLWATSMSHFLKLLTASFWANEYAAKGVTAVHLPKIHGQRMITDANGHGTPYRMPKMTRLGHAESERTMPEGYHANRGGLIMRKDESSPRIFSFYHDEYRQPPAADEENTFV